MPRPGLRGLAVLALLAPAAALAAEGLPNPESVLGFRPGEDFRLARYDRIVEYYRRLDAASDRIQVLDIGPTAAGRRMILAILSSEANLARLERYRGISRRLALGRGLDEAAARRLAAEGRTVVWIDGGLHATEVASAQHSPELAWRVVSDESDEMRRIRDDVILLQVPVMNPDGLEIVADWYERNRGTPYATAPLPELYHRWAGHDNNRDWYMFNLPESRNAAHYLFDLWIPQIVYDHHQAPEFPARIFVPPFDDPMNPNIPPLVMRGIQLIGSAMARRFEAERKPGVLGRLGFDTWWNGGLRTAPYFHNQIGILTETAIFRYAHPRTYTASEIPERFSNGWPTGTPTTYYPSPWPGGAWGPRAAIEYMLTASLALLDAASRHRSAWLLDVYRMGAWAIEAGARGDPYAYVIPNEQWDPGAARRLLEALAIGGIEIGRATAPFAAGGVAYPAGTHVIPMAQPFRASAKDLLEPQRYPGREVGGAPHRPYDLTGWTLPYQMGVEARAVAAPFAVSLEPARPSAPRIGSVRGRGRVAYAFTHRANASFRAANRLLASGESVSWTAAAAGALEVGTMLVLSGRETRSRVEALAAELGVDFTAVDIPPDLPLLRLREPRLGLYRSWLAPADEGWTRWLLEQHEFRYDTVTDAELRRGGLRGRLDVVVLPALSREEMEKGWATGEMPPEYVGGMGRAGIDALREFVRAGGVLVAMDVAGDLVTREFGVPVRDTLEGRGRADFHCPGSLVAVDVDARHPLAWGMPARARALFLNSPAYETAPPAGGASGLSDGVAPGPVRVVARYAERDLLQSGWLIGPEHLRGRAAVLEIEVGRGKVLLLGFRTQHRGQTDGTFKLLFNALLYGTATPGVLR